MSVEEPPDLRPGPEHVSAAPAPVRDAGLLQHIGSHVINLNHFKHPEEGVYKLPSP